MAERFYLNWPLHPGPVELTGPEAHHLATVSRLRAGDAIALFNGDGQEYPARVAAVGRKAVTLDVQDARRPDRELPFDLEIAAPLPKGDRGQFLVEKLTELGATAYIPLVTRRSVVNPGEGKLEKLERYVIEASKQCGRNVLMRVEEPAEWLAFCRGPRECRVRLLAQPGGGEHLDHLVRGARLLTTADSDASICFRLAFGPEGGLTDEEADAARESGWHVVGLGPRILRIETAALALAAQVVGFMSENA
jgi:16S rRNA (uracil1498-N3)-methyltransferase